MRACALVCVRVCLKLLLVLVAGVCQTAFIHERKFFAAAYLKPVCDKRIVILCRINHFNRNTEFLTQKPANHFADLAWSVPETLRKMMQDQSMPVLSKPYRVPVRIISSTELCTFFSECVMITGVHSELGHRWKKKTHHSDKWMTKTIGVDKNGQTVQGIVNNDL